MTFTYSGNPSLSDLDQVRFLISDTVADDAYLQNEEIAFLLTQEGAPLKAAVRACEAIAARYSRLADTRVGDVSISYSQTAKAFTDLAKILAKRASIRLSTWYAGGITKSDKQIQEIDTDRVEPSFTRELHQDQNNVNTDGTTD